MIQSRNRRIDPSLNPSFVARSSREPTQNPVEENATPSPTYQGNGQRSNAAVAVVKPMQILSQSWTKVSSGNRKNGTKKLATGVKVEQCGRRILKNGNQSKSEADLMLALNETLQKAGVQYATSYRKS